MMMGNAYRYTGQYEEAVSNYKKALLRGPKFWDLAAHVGLAASYIMLGREKEARSEAAEVLRINPRFTIEDYFQKAPFKDRSVLVKHMDALRKAGLK